MTNLTGDNYVPHEDPNHEGNSQNNGENPKPVKPDSEENFDFERKLPLPITVNPKINLEALLKEAEWILSLPKPKEKGLFTVMSCNEWMEQASRRPIPNMLFSEFWYEGELCMLFADTNTGKSILAVQIADSISRGIPIPGFKITAQPQTVVYFDFELFDKQFEARYSNNFTQHYCFDKNMYRSELSNDMDMPKEFETFEEYLYFSLEKTILETKTRVLVIDNVTYLKSETERAKDALPLMKHLKDIKKKFELSILALAHTPKRDMSKPLTRNDLQGSKMLINFADSAFCIGESSRDKSLRYLKQIKARNTEHIYDGDNVCLCRIEKPFNFLGFTHAGNGTEREHLREQDTKDRDFLIAEVKRLSGEGMTQREIAAELGIGKGTVSKYTVSKYLGI